MIITKAFICAISPRDSQDDKIYPEHYLNNIYQYIPN